MTSPVKTTLIACAAFALGLAAAGLVSLGPFDRQHSGETAEAAAPADEPARWTCAMHPQIVLDEPGDCPVCGMKLNPAPARKILYWRAPMDPAFLSDKPGKSPMGMDLVPVFEDEAAPADGAVRVNPGFLQNFAVRTAAAERSGLTFEIRTVGVLGHNEETVVSVNTKYDGWIEKAYRNNVGELVAKGEPLFDVYSPQLVTTQQEYLAALDYARKLAGAAYPEAVARAQALVESGRERLRYWDVGDREIVRLDATRKAARTVTVHAPVSGFIVSKMGDSLEGMRLTPGMTVVKLADHSRLWVEAELYEDDIRRVRRGARVSVQARAFPGRKWGGSITLFDTALDPRTRTLKAFAEIENPDLKLRPGMFVDVVIRPPGIADAVTVPQQAVLHSGERAVVIVERSRGVFEPREVRLGAVAGDKQQIAAGIEAGERIVTSSQFLIDSESNLRAAVGRLLDNAAGPAPAHQHGGATHVGQPR